MILIGGIIFGIFVRHKARLHSNSGRNGQTLTGTARSGILTDRHVNEMMTTAGKKFQNF